MKQSSGALCYHAKDGKANVSNRTSQGQAEEAEFTSIGLKSLHWLVVVIADSTATGLEKRKRDIQRWREREKHIWGCLRKEREMKGDNAPTGITTENSY